MKKITIAALTIILLLAGCAKEEEGGGENIMSLPPLKEQFTDCFLMGNIFNPADASSSGITNARLTRHFNVLTAENDMKPQSLNSSRGSYNYATADRMVNAALASGFKVQGHTLLWHSQIPPWQGNLRNDATTKEDALEYMKTYITDVVTHFKGRIYAWDVINEAFPDGVSASADWKTSMRKDASGGNPWFIKIGSEFVFEGFKAARLADPDTILYYNDYNLDQVGKSTMVRNMVRDVNQEWVSDPNYDGRKLIEGIGMQSHHNTGVSAAAIRTSLALFRALGVKISISELDVLAQSWGQFSAVGQGANKQNQTTVTDQGLSDQARLYGEYMKVYIENKDIIERVTLWGVTDNQSWRSAGLPLLFNPAGNAKQAYYGFVGAL